MRLRTLGFAVALVALYSTAVEAREAAFVYANGVWNTRAMAERSGRALGEEIRIYFGLSTEEFAQRFGTIEIAYNHTTCRPGSSPIWCVADAYEALVQVRGLSDRSYWRIFNRLNGSPFADLIIVSDYANSTIPAAPQTLAIAESDLITHIKLYRSLLQAGSKVIIVPHSQGNFFANFAFEFFDPNEEPSIGVVSVATPASFVAGDGPYRTLLGDFIHSVPGALPPNTTNGDCGSSFECHGFVESYLKGSTSGPQILGHIAEMLESLAPPTPPEPPSPVTVTLHPTFTLATYDSVDLRWDNNADEDFLEYRVYRSIDPSVDEEDELIVVIPDQRVRFLRHEGAFLSDTDYFYRVFVRDQSGLSAESNEVHARRFSVEAQDPRLPDAGTGGFPADVLVPDRTVALSWFVCTDVDPITLTCRGHFARVGPAMNSAGTILKERFFSADISDNIIAGQSVPVIILLERELLSLELRAIDQDYTIRLPSHGSGVTIPLGQARFILGMFSQSGSFDWSLETVNILRSRAMELRVLP